MQGTTPPASYTIGAGAARAQATPLLSALYILFAGLALLRVALNPLLLDLVMNYSTDSGSVIEKLHPALYGFVAIALVALPCFRIVLGTWEVRVVRAMLAFNVGILLILASTALAGRGGSTGFMIDTYCGACFAILLFLFPEEWRPKVGQALLLWLALSAIVAIIEFGLKTRLQPFDETESAFRPTGLAAHPLDLGLWMAMGPVFTAATTWSRRTKVVIGLLFLAGLGVSGARTALVVGSVATTMVAIAAIGARTTAQLRFERRIVATIALIAVIPLAVLALAATGGLDRFVTGTNDANAQTRIDIYGVFSHMTWPQMLFGMDPSELRFIAKTFFGLDSVESSVVMFVALFGAVGTAVFAGLFAWVLRILLMGARPCVVLGCGVFLVIALSSNGLSTKGSGIFLLFTLIIALRPVRRVAAWA